MLLLKDVRRALNRELAAAYPGRPIYIGFCPAGFRRPSLLLELVKSSAIPIAPNTVRRKAYFTLTAFDAVDESGRGTGEEGVVVCDKICALFAAGTLKADDRSLSVITAYGGENAGECYVDITVEFADDEGRQSRFLPPMGEVKTKIKQEG